MVRSVSNSIFCSFLYDVPGPHTSGQPDPRGHHDRGGRRDRGVRDLALHAQRPVRGVEVERLHVHDSVGADGLDAAQHAQGVRRRGRAEPGGGVHPRDRSAVRAQVGAHARRRHHRGLPCDPGARADDDPVLRASDARRQDGAVLGGRARAHDLRSGSIAEAMRAGVESLPRGQKRPATRSACARAA